MTPEQRKYRQAAIAYFVYGVIYLTGAIYLVQIGEAERGMGADQIWWIIIGAALVICLPVLIWKEFKWLTRILAVLVFVRILGLLRLIIFGRLDTVAMPWGDEMREAYGAVVFAVVAAITCFFLVRASWPTRFFRAKTE